MRVTPLRIESTDSTWVQYEEQWFFAPLLRHDKLPPRKENYAQLRLSDRRFDSVISEITSTATIVIRCIGERAASTPLGSTARTWKRDSANTNGLLTLHRKEFTVMGCMFCLSCGVFLTFAIIWAIWMYWTNSKKPKKTICILVLGDIGRSPRMQYHALSFAREGFTVDLVGYPGSEPLQDLRDNPAVKIHYLRSSNVQNMPRLLGYLVKTLTQTSVLLWKFFVDIDSSYVLVQNPPAVPTLLICWLYCRFAGARFIIDWHNYAFTIMSLGLGSKHVLVTITRFFEAFFGGRADKNFCVTKAMSDDLKSRWGINAEVLYDRPPIEFKPINLQEKHALMMKLGKIYEAFGDGDDSSRFTERLESGEIRLRTDRPGFIVSSTSWTDDEDFSILFNALHEYEIACESVEYNLPDLVCAVTGKGPLKEFWNAIVQRKNWRHIKIVTPWLENEDYPKLLASADLGVSLHTSSSGLDLPMKVVDMFGCGLPVCAVNYNCLHELVRHEENSLVFSNEKELAQQLKTWFHNFPNNDEQREIKDKFQRELTKFRELRWHGNWSSVVIPCLD